MNNNPIPRRDPRRIANAIPVNYAPPVRRRRANNNNPVLIGNPNPNNNPNNNPIPANNNNANPPNNPPNNNPANNAILVNNPNNNRIVYNGPVVPRTLQDYKKKYAGKLTIALTKQGEPIECNEYSHMEFFARHEMVYFDLIVFPKDSNEFHYLLVAIDACSRNVDFEPIKWKRSDVCLLALRRILARRYITMPYRFAMTDNGKEFKGVFERFLTANNVIVRKERQSRFSQLAIMNNICQTISKHINVRMSNSEIDNPALGSNTNWTKGLGILRTILNTPKYLHAPPPMPDVFQPVNFKIKANEEPLNIGENVRIKLDYPINPAKQDEMLYGSFRSGDLRFSSEIYTIENIVLNIGQPILYRVEGIKNALYLKKQLQVVHNIPDEGEANPDLL